MKHIILYMVALLFHTAVNAQNILPDMTLKKDFEAQVKSMDEFQARFNGKEKKPGMKPCNDSLSRINNLVSLFDFQLNKGNLTKEQFHAKIFKFINAIISNNVRFDMLSPNVISECKCRFKYLGKDEHITLLFKKELYEKGIYRWTISGVRGLKEAGIVNVEKYYSISPVEHEIFFMGLRDMFNENPARAFGYRSKMAKIDELSVLMTLIYTGAIKFDIVEEQIFHCLDVPGYVFTIKEHIRTGTNSGWLINNFFEVNKKEKYINRVR